MNTGWAQGKLNSYVWEDGLSLATSLLLPPNEMHAQHNQFISAYLFVSVLFVLLLLCSLDDTQTDDTEVKIRVAISMKTQMLCKDSMLCF